MISATHSRSGASASKRRSTKSGAGRAWGSRRVVRGPLRRLTPGQACLTHLSTFGRQENPFPRHPLAAHRRALSGQLGVNSRRPVRPTAAFVNRSHARAQRLVRGLARRALTGAPRVVPARGDTEDRASSRSERNFGGHRGDSKLGPIRSHEPVDLPGPVSRANQAVAFAKVSRSSRSRRISRRRRRISSRSAVLGPSPRRPSSRSACTTQLRIACAVGSNSRDNSSALRPARTNSTIWCRNSGAYGGLDLGMVDPSSPKGQVSTNSDQIQYGECGWVKDTHRKNGRSPASRARSKIFWVAKNSTSSS